MGKVWRVLWWILFPPIGFILTQRHKRRQREAVEAQRHSELVAAQRERDNAAV